MFKKALLLALGTSSLFLTAVSCSNNVKKPPGDISVQTRPPEEEVVPGNILMKGRLSGSDY